MVKIGLFGVGHLGRIHAKLINELDNKYEFTGFYDPNEINAQTIINDQKITFSISLISYGVSLSNIYGVIIIRI